MNPPKKRCSKCRKVKPYYDFHMTEGCKDGLYSQCMVCAHAANKQHISDNHMAMLIRVAKRRAVKKGLPFDLSAHKDELVRRREVGLCELTGIPFRDTKVSEGQGPKWNSPSIDRIKPDLGYVYSNIRIVLHAINSMMGDWGESIAGHVMHAYLNNRR